MDPPARLDRATRQHESPDAGQGWGSRKQLTKEYDMSRPLNHDDLDDYARQGHLVASIPSEYLTRHPSLGAHLLAAVAEADRLGLVRDADGSIRIPKTEDELDAALKSAQRSWDYNAERWEKSMQGDPEACPSYMRTSLNMWAKAEGRDLVDWDALDTEAAR